jgi:hypothetical protein
MVCAMWCVPGHRLVGNTRSQFHYHEAVPEIAL